MAKRVALTLVIWLAAGAAQAGEPAVPDAFSGSLRVLGGLILVIGLILVLLAVARRRGSLLPGVRAGQIRIVEMKHLGPKKSVALVEVRGQSFLLGIGAESVRLISPVEGAADSFADKLQQNLERTS